MKGTVFDFSTGYGLIDTGNITKIHEYLMKKHTVKFIKYVFVVVLWFRRPLTVLNVKKPISK